MNHIVLKTTAPLWGTGTLGSLQWWDLEKVQLCFDFCLHRALAVASDAQLWD